MIDQIREQVKKALKDLDGVVALRLTEQGTAPYLFQDGDDLSQLVMESLLQDILPSKEYTPHYISNSFLRD